MSKTKNTTGGVPPTEVKKPDVVKLNKTQRELFATKRNQFNEDMKTVIDTFNKLSSEILGKLVDNFIEELEIDIVGENWNFDANAMQFTKTAKAEKK